jgi:glycosyltransferase involved in cell wall biosynthesis
MTTSPSLDNAERLLLPETATRGGQRRRLLMVLPDLAGGGAQRVTLRLLRSFDPQRFELSLLVLDGPGELSLYVPGNVRLIHVPRRFGLRLGKLATLWHGLRADVLIAATELRASFCVHFAARLLRKPAVGWVRIAFGEYAAQLSERNRRRARRTYGDFQRLVFVSDGARESFQRWYGERRDSWVTIFNPFDAEEIEAPLRAAEAKPPRPLLVGIGRLEARKGFDLLIRAAGIARRAGADFDLAILGEGPLREALRAQAAQQGIGDRLLMPGFVHDVSAWLRRSSAYVLSSRIEGLPGTILEAFAAGAPVIATRCPHGPEELLQQGACGRLVAVDDAEAMAQAITELLASPSLCRELSLLGHRRLRDFAPATILPQWQALIDGLLPQRRAA